MLDGRNLEKDIIDRGWQDMSTVLDAEMPLHNSRRKGLIWWVLGLALILMVILSYKFILTGNGSASSNIIPESVVNSSNQINSSESFQNLDKNNVDNIDNESINKGGDGLLFSDESKEDDEKNGKEKRLNAQDLTDNQNLKENPGTISEIRNNQGDPINQSQDIGQNQKEKIYSIQKENPTISETEIAGNEDHQPENILQNQYQKQESFRKVIDMVRLPVRGYAVSSERLVLNPLLIEPVKINNRNWWLAYASSRVINQENLNLELGVAYEIPLSSRISLLPQVGYGFDRIEYLSMPASSRAVEFSLANGLNSESLVSNLQINNEKGNYLSLGLDGNFNVWKRWKVLTGINYRVYSSFSGSSEELANEDLSGPDQAGGMPTSTAEIRSNNDLFYRLGVYHQVSNRVGAGIYYNHQTNDPFEVIINGLKDTEATSDFFPRKHALRIFMTFGF